MEPALAGALGRRDGARVGQLASLLADAGRSANVERLYIAARLPALQVPPVWHAALSCSAWHGASSAVAMPHGGPPVLYQSRKGRLCKD